MVTSTKKISSLVKQNFARNTGVSPVTRVTKASDVVKQKLRFYSHVTLRRGEKGNLLFSPVGVTHLEHKLPSRVFPEAVHDQVHSAELPGTPSGKATSPVLSGGKKHKLTH